MLSLPKTHLYVPDFIEEPVNKLLDAYRGFQRCEMPCDVTPMQVSTSSASAELALHKNTTFSISASARMELHKSTTFSLIKFFVQNCMTSAQHILLK